MLTQSCAAHDCVVIPPHRNPELVSGCSLEERETLHDRFLGALEEKKPGVLEPPKKDGKSKQLADLFENKSEKKHNKEKEGFKFNFF